MSGDTTAVLRNPPTSMVCCPQCVPLVLYHEQHATRGALILAPNQCTHFILLANPKADLMSRACVQCRALPSHHACQLAASAGGDHRRSRAGPMPCRGLHLMAASSTQKVWRSVPCHTHLAGQATRNSQIIKTVQQAAVPTATCPPSPLEQSVETPLKPRAAPVVEATVCLGP
jgi:hypothetical protein